MSQLFPINPTAVLDIESNLSRFADRLRLLG